MGIQEGLLLRQGYEEGAARTEEAKLKAALYGAQAKHYETQNKLLDLEMGKQQRFMALAQQAQPPPGLPSEVASQPAGPQAPMTVGDLHTTALFADHPSVRRLNTLGDAAAQAGLGGEAGKYYGDANALRTQMLAARTQGVQQRLGMLQEMLSTPNLPPERAQEIRGAMAILYQQIGKFDEALKYTQGTLTPMQAGGGLLRTLPGGATETIIAPLPLSEKALQEQQGRNRAAGGVPASAPAPSAADLEVLKRQRLLRPDTPQDPAPPLAAPPAGQREFLFRTEQGGTGIVYAKDLEEARRLILADPTANSKSPVIVETPSASVPSPAPTPSAPNGKGGRRQESLLEQEERQKTETALRARGLEPGNPQNPVNKQEAEAATAGQPLDQYTRIQLASLVNADRILRSIEAVPEAQMKTWIGLLRKTPQAFADFLQDARAAGGGDPDRYKFLADINDLYYHLSRQEVGANFTQSEQELLQGVYPNANEKTYTGFRATLMRLRPLLEGKIRDQITLGGTTRGRAAEDVKTLRGPARGAAAPAPENAKRPASEMSPEELFRALGESLQEGK